MNEIIYGPGGFDPSHPNGNIVEQVADNGDGTGTRTTYDDKGTVVETETITGLPIPEVDDTPADPAAVLADLAARLAAIPATATSAAVRTELRTIGTDLLSALTPEGNQP